MKVLRFVPLLLVLPLLAACGKAYSGSGAQAKFPPVVSVQEVKAAMDRKENFTVIGVVNPTRGLVPFSQASKHIPGSYLVWRPDYSSGGSADAIGPEVTGMRRSVAEMEALLSRAGLGPDSTVVVWSVDSMHDAARFVWQLQILGMKNVSYIDGGSNAWTDAGFRTRRGTRLSRQSPRSEFRAPNYAPERFSVTIAEVVNALENPDEWVVIDTRSGGEYNGEQTGSSAGAFGTGRIAGAVHINWSRAVNPDTNLLRSKEELQAIYLDAIAGRKVIAFCQSGVRSAHTGHVLTHVLGLENVYNYDGSWIEWSFAASSASGNAFPRILELTEEWTDNGKPL